MSASDVARAAETLERFRTLFGYPAEALTETLVALRKYRY
jgi:hypothetical protein